jgi:hypothetical protein
MRKVRFVPILALLSFGSPPVQYIRALMPDLPIPE